ncbi:MAG: phosphoribosylglycinamide formyltransferase [Candidatus Micrarchaeota archaeon]
MLKIAVLASFNGSNFQAIVDAMQRGALKNVELAALASNKPDCGAVEKAKAAGVKTIILKASKNQPREEYDKQLAAALDELGVQLVVLAGWFRMLSPWFVKKYCNKIINLHPSLLPAFPGGCSDAQKRALEWGVKVTGCTVHFVDEGEDTGPIIVQKTVRVEEGDDEESLSARIRLKEHEALIEAIQLIADNRVSVEGKRVRIK